MQTLLTPIVKTLARAALVLGLVALIGGCLPIGARVSNMYAPASTGAR